MNHKTRKEMIKSTHIDGKSQYAVLGKEKYSKSLYVYSYQINSTTYINESELSNIPNDEEISDNYYEYKKPIIENEVREVLRSINNPDLQKYRKELLEQAIKILKS